MKTDLAGLFRNVTRELKSCRSDKADYYDFVLNEVLQHIEETVRGEHSIDEFADHYCINRAQPAEKVAS